jgi:hypothetical protein
LSQGPGGRITLNAAFCDQWLAGVKPGRTSERTEGRAIRSHATEDRSQPKVDKPPQLVGLDRGESVYRWARCLVGREPRHVAPCTTGGRLLPASGLLVASKAATRDCRHDYVRFWGVLIRSARCLPSNCSGCRWNRWFHSCFSDEKTAYSKTCDNPLWGSR